MIKIIRFLYLTLCKIWQKIIFEKFNLFKYSKVIIINIKNI